ncbi:MAG: hypothetical protein COA79_07245 [Planctomycetota bacterium]|nr:MAG: hypothetical protein COA79_07245 [Planctomycetota bacterium]
MKNKSLIFVTLFILSILFVYILSKLLHENVKPTETSSTSKTHHQSQGVVHIATEEYPPSTSFTLMNNGIACHIVKEDFKLQGLEVQYHFYPGARSFEQAKSGFVDASLPWVKTKEREKYFHYGAPVMVSDAEHFFYIKGTDFNWDAEKPDFSKIKNKKIGAIISYDYGKEFQAAEKQKMIDVIRISTQTQSFEMLFSGRIQALTCEYNIGMYQLINKFTKEQRSKIIHIRGGKSSVEYDYIIFTKKRKNGKELQGTFAKGLKQLKDSGKYQQYLDEYKNGKYSKEISK